MATLLDGDEEKRLLEEEKKLNDASKKIVDNLISAENEIVRDIFQPSELGEALSGVERIKRAANVDPTPTIESLYTHDPYGDPNMFVDRYQAFGSAYDRLGFSPYRNNEAVYNNYATDWEKWKKSFNAFCHLTWIALQQNSVIGSGMSDNSRTKKLANEYNYWNTIGMDSGEGVGAFARNLLVTYGSTAAVMLKMAVEEIAINVGITALTGGTGTAGTMAATSARFAKFGNFMNKVREGLKSANVIRKAYKQAGGWKRFGYTFSEFIAPGTWSGIARGVHNIKKGRTLEGSLNMLHGMYSTARAYKVTQSEALLEANLSAQEYVMEMYNSGKQFTDEQIEIIKRSAEAISNEVFWKNIPAIYLSNLVIFNDLLSPTVGRFMSKTFKGPSKLFGKMPQRLSHGKWYNQIYRVGEKVQRRSEYFAKGIPLFLGYNAGKGLKMFAVGSVEGLQENVQDIINYSAKKYYQDMYLDNERFQEVLGSSVDASGIWNAFKTDHLLGYSEAYKQQFSKQGWETFFTGTLIGGPTALISTTLRSGFKAGEFAIDKHKLNQLKKELNNTSKESSNYQELEKQYKAKEKAFNYKYDVDNVRSDEWLKIYDQVFNKPTDFFNKNLENIVNINATTEDAKEEIERFNNLINEVQDESLKEVLIQERDMAEERAKIRQWNMIFRQLCANGEIDLVKSELEHLKNEDDDVLSELNNGDNPEDVKKRIDECIKTIDLTQRVYDGLIDRFSNPQNMKGFLKKFNCKTEEEFLLKYGDNADIMQLYDNERMLGVAYSRAIDEMVYYANEYQIAEKDRLSLKKIIDKWFRFLDRIDSEEGEPVLPEEKKEDKSILGIIEKTNKGVEIENRYLPRDSALTDLTSLYTKESIASLMESNSVIIESLKSQLKDTENESERNELNDRIENFETRNKQLGIIVNSLNGYKTDEEGKILKDDNGKKIQLDAEEFSDTIQNALHKYMSIVQGGPNQDTLTYVFVDYFESYRNSSKLYYAYQTITNPRNFNAIIENRNRILMDIYNKRFGIIQDSIAQYKKDSIANDLINKLYNEGYAVDNNFIARLLNKTSNKAGKIYKISDKNFNKEEVITSERPVTVYKYKDIDEAFKNSFDVELHPLSKEYHDIVKFIEQWINDRNQKDGTNLDAAKLFRLQSNSDFQQAKTNNEFVQPNQTVESIEEEYFDNKTDRLDLFEVTRVKHNINDVLDKIYNKMSETNPLRSLITALKKYNEQNNIKVVLTTNDNTKLPYTIYDNTIFIDTRYFDKRYFTDQLQGFEFALLKANVEHIIRNELVKGKGQKIVKDLADVFGIEYEDERNIKDIAGKLSSFMLGTRQDRLVSSIDTEGMDKIKKSDAFYDFVNSLSDYLSKMNITTGANQQYVTNLLDAIQVLFSGVGNYVAPKPSTPVNSTVTPSPSGTPVVTPKGTKVVNIGNSIDIDEDSISKSYSELSNIQRFVIWYSPKSTNVAKWLENKQHLANKDYQKDKSNIEKRKETYKQAKIQNNDITGGNEVAIETAREYTRISQLDENNYVYIEYFGIDQDELDEYNKAITTTALQPVTPNTNVSIIGSIEGYGKKIEVDFNQENHEYTFIDENGNRILTDTTASSFTDELYKILNPDYNASTESTASTAIGNVYDAAMREYFNTGKVTNAIFDVFEQNGILVNADTKLRNALLDNLNNICKDAMQKIVDTIDKGADVSNFKFNTDEKKYIVRVNVTDNNGEQRSYTVGMSHDMIVEHNGKLYLVDFKTTKKDKLGQYNLQTYLYAKALEKISGQKFAGRMVISQTKVMPTDISNITDDELKSLFSGDATVKEFNTEPSVSLEENGNKMTFTVTDVTLLGESSNTIQQTTNDVINDFIGTGKSANKKETFNIILLLDAIRSNSLDKTEVLNGVLEGYKYSGKPKSLHIVKYESTTDGSIVFALSTDDRFNSGYNVVGRYALSQYTTDIVNELQSNVEISQSSNVVDNEVVNQKMMQYNELLADITEDNENYDANNLKELLTKLCK